MEQFRTAGLSERPTFTAEQPQRTFRHVYDVCFATGLERRRTASTRPTDFILIRQATIRVGQLTVVRFHGAVGATICALANVLWSSTNSGRGDVRPRRPYLMIGSMRGFGARTRGSVVFEGMRPSLASTTNQ